MKRLVLLMVFSCCVSVGFAQQIMWDREWIGQGFNDIFSNIAVDADTNIVVSGVSTLTGGNGYPAHWVKYNKNGTQLWQKYGRNLTTGEQDIIAYGNGYLFAGSQRVQDAVNIYNTTDFGLHWLNSNGDTIQNTRFGSLQYGDTPVRILPVNNDIFVLGTTLVPKTNITGLSINYSLLKLSNNGTTQQWYKNYGGDNTEYASCLIRNSRGNLVMSGISDGRITATPYHPFLVEVNNNGDTIRSKQLIIKSLSLTEENRRFFHNIAETADGNYIMSGGIQHSSSPNVYENFIVKLDASFNKIWVYYDAVTTSFFNFSKVQQLSDGSYVVLMSGDNAIPGDYHIVKVSATGQFISRTTYNSPITGNVLTYDWEFLGDGSVVVAGKTSANEAYIARLGNVGIPAVISSVAEPIAREAKLGQSYPNPAASEATIPYQVNPSVKEAELRIYEVATGKIIQAISLDVNVRQINLDLKPVKQGVYSYTLYEDGLPTATKKMVVLK